MAAQTILFYIFAFLYGIVIGSFLNVCIYRIPQKESVVAVGSHCMNCQHRLAWYDLFPLFSFLILRGRCRYCKAKLSWQYPLVECLNGVLYIVIIAARGMNFVVKHGLHTRVKVDNAKPLKAERRLLCHVALTSVRPAVLNGFHHFFKHRFLVIRISDNPAYSAHTYLSSFAD